MKNHSDSRSLRRPAAAIFVVASVACGSIPGRAAEADGALLAHYTFDEGEQAGRVMDQVSPANHGTLYGAGYVELAKGHALACDSWGNFAKLAGTRVLNLGTGDFTVDLWMKLDAYSGGTVLGKAGPGPESPGWRLEWEEPDRTLAFHLGDGRAKGSVRARFTDRGWHHVAAVRQGDTLTLYLDGSMAARESGHVFAADVSNEKVFLRFGMVSGFRAIQGKLDEIRLHRRALTEAEIAAQHGAHQEAMARAEALDAPVSDDPLVLHFTFDEDTGQTAHDSSPHGHHAALINPQYIEAFDGRRGIMRFDGKDAKLTCPVTEALRIHGDLTFEMWVRESGTPEHSWGVLFGDGNDFDFYFAGYHSLVLWHTARHPQYKNESMLMPMERTALGGQWSHIAVVVEYPRCRFYHNGVLSRDAYMPLPGMENNVNTPFEIGARMPMDLDEFRLYSRALTAAEVAAHHRGEEADPGPTAEVTIEPHWYEDTVTVRLATKGADYYDHQAQLTLTPGGKAQGVKMSEAFAGCGRYVASAFYPLNALEGRPVTATVRIVDPAGETVRELSRDATLTKPEWVDSRAGYSDEVPAPWTPVTVEEGAGGVTVGVWGRQYRFTRTSPFPSQIEANGSAILQSPIALTCCADGNEIAWDNPQFKLASRRDMGTKLLHGLDSDALALRVGTYVEFDGYMTIDCRLKALRDVTVDELSLEIPLETKRTPLGYGDRVLPPDPEVAIAEFFSGLLKEDQAFRFSPTIWLGDVEHGLCWQAESDENWHYADPQKAIEILLRDDATVFKARFVDVSTALKAGDTLHYRFALQATPIKPLLRDTWDLRVVRGEPYGLDLDLPDRVINGIPAIRHLKESGARHLFTTGCDLWPYPLPVHERYGKLLRRLNDEMHAHGLKIYNYQMHQRFATAAPEFDIHGLHMAQRPMNQYLPGNNPIGHPRPGPVAVAHGAGSQGTVFHCPKSMALQDANMHALAKRIDLYDDDGVYLDGTNSNPPCKNLGHGCGYVDEDGTIRETYPVFAARRQMQRLYHVIKSRKPDGVVDVHCSFGYNPPSLGYADIIWTGEQWHHLRKTGAEHIASEMTLDKFRTEFMGSPIGVAADTLSYRLGSRVRVSSTSLLHDIPVRPNNLPPDLPGARTSADVDYARLISRLWKVRDRFAAHEARKLFYWNNQEYVTVGPDLCNALLLHHPRNGVLAFITNRGTEAQDVKVSFNLDRLGLDAGELEVFNALTGDPVALAADGAMAIPLEAERWQYIWLRPADSSRN